MGISDYSGTPASNTALNGIPVTNNTAADQVDDLIRQLMADQADLELTDDVTVASASTCDILGTASSRIRISGSTAINSFGTGAHKIRWVRFVSSLELRHNATSLILPGGENITTQAGDTCVVVSNGSSNCRVYHYQPADGGSVSAEWEIIASGSVSSAASLDLTDLSTTYRAYVLSADNLRPVTSGVEFVMRTSTDNGSNFESGATSYQHARVVGGTSAVTAVGSSGASVITLVPALGTQAASVLVWVFNPASSASTTIAVSEAFHRDSSSEFVRVSGGGRRNNTEANDAIRFHMSSGNIDTMNYTLYGLRAS